MFFVHNSVGRIVHGCGSVKEAGNEVKRLGGKRVVIVTDPGLAKLDVQKPLEEVLKADGIECKLYAEAELEPSMDSIQHCADFATSFKADVLIGFGGGSALDTTKAAAVLLTNDGPIDKYFGMNKVPNPCLPTILIPTTSGTGSEMTSISVLADTKNGGKQGVVSDYMYANTVLLDPELTLGLPPRVTAITGVDAFVHAMESYCGIAATPFTDALNLQAMKLISANIRKAYANGSNLEARSAMLYASALAGLGFSNTQNGIIHAIGTTLPTEYHQPHGLLMSVVAPMGIAFNHIANPEKYAIVDDILRGECGCGGNELDRAADCEAAFVDMLNDLDIVPGLAPYGFKREELAASAERAFNAKRLINNNPRRANAAQILALMEKYY